MSPAQATAPAARRSAGRTIPVPVPSRRLRRRMIALVALAALLAAGYTLWLRDSGLVAVRTVKVTGLSGTDSARIRSALDAAARNMTTLHVDRARLERAVSAFPVVRAVEATPDFPHGLRVHVVQRRPAALLVAHSGRVSVAGDGTVLTGLRVKGELPLIRLAGAMPARRVSGEHPLAAVRVAGAMPVALRPRVAEIIRQPGRGVVVPLKGGPKLIFGDGSRARAQWAAAMAVLADGSAAGADYVDLRIPERPAAGGLPVETVAPAAPAAAPGAAAPAPAPAAAVGQAPSGTQTRPAAPTTSAPTTAPAVPQQGRSPVPAAGGGAAAPNP